MRHHQELALTTCMNWSRLEEKASYEEAETILINQGIAMLGFEVVWEGDEEGEHEIGINAPTTTGVAEIPSCKEYT